MINSNSCTKLMSENSNICKNYEMGVHTFIALPIKHMECIMAFYQYVQNIYKNMYLYKMFKMNLNKNLID